jgi:hypothetical protein
MGDEFAKSNRVLTPWLFFVSRHEVAVSKKERERYRIYRVFDFQRVPHFFQKCGQIDAAFSLEPLQYEPRLT